MAKKETQRQRRGAEAMAMAGKGGNGEEREMGDGGVREERVFMLKRAAQRVGGERTKPEEGNWE